MITCLIPCGIEVWVNWRLSQRLKLFLNQFCFEAGDIILLNETIAAPLMINNLHERM